MSHPTTLQYLDGLRLSRLLDAERLSELEALPEAAWGDTDALSRHAQSRGWLSPYQVNELREGRWNSLVIGAYRLIERIATHPGYDDFQAVHPSLQTPVHLRVIRDTWLFPADEPSTYLSRIQSASLVNSPHLTNILDAGVEGQTLFAVQEYADGCSISQLISEMGAMPVSLAVEYIRQAATAIAAAHDRCVFHGQVTPQTLILTPVKRVVHETTGFVSVRPRLGSIIKVTDLALSPLRPPMSDITYGNSEQLGSIEYLPPERMNNPGPDAAGDLYGLGATLFFLLTNRAPYAGNNVLEVMLELQQSNPTSIESLRSDLPPEIIVLINRCLSRNTFDRPSAHEIISLVLPFCEAAAMPQLAAPVAVPSASETFTQPGIPTAAVVEEHTHAPVVEPLPEVHPLEEHHEDHDPFGPSGNSPPKARVKVKPKNSAAWVLAGLLLHGTGVLLLVGWLTNWFAFLRTPDKPEETKIEKKADPPPKKKPARQ